MSRETRETFAFLAAFFGIPAAFFGGILLFSIGFGWLGIPLVVIAVLAWCWVVAGGAG